MTGRRRQRPSRIQPEPRAEAPLQQLRKTSEQRPRASPGGRRSAKSLHRALDARLRVEQEIGDDRDCRRGDAESAEGIPQFLQFPAVKSPEFLVAPLEE